MGLTKVYLGDLIELTTETNNQLIYGAEDVMGMTITKEIIPTKANVGTTDLSKFLVVHPDEFVFNPRTHGTKIGFGYNDLKRTFLISWNNIAFRVRECKRGVILPEYLFLHFNRSEWDREACFRSWGSSTEVFSWEALCEMTIMLPPLTIQQKYVNIYNAMLENQRCYESALEDLKLICDAYIDKLKVEIDPERIGPYLDLVDERNADLELCADDVRGISIQKTFIPTKADMTGVSLKPYYIVRPDYFAYVTVTSRNGEKISLAYNNTERTFICSSSYVVFCINNTEKLCPGYLQIFLNRAEFDRYARFHSWGSARETFDWSEMCDVQIPIPDIKIQQYIVNIYTAYLLRKEINEQLKAQVKNVCPILIKGSLEEAENG